MNAKKWSLTLISVTLVLAVLFGAAEFLLDPLLQYGKEPGRLSYRYYSELYSNPGIAKNYDYNAVLTGSSMVENTNVSEIDDLFGCTTIKVPYSGGTAYNYKVILDVCYNSGNKIDYVFWALDEHALTTDKSTSRYPLPEYLYDDTKTNDLSYLLNLDIFYFYTVKDILGILKNKSGRMMTDGSRIKDESVYCRENALASIDFPMKEKDNQGDLVYEKNLYDNLNENILPLIENHPETEFNFYMVPYSILYWYQKKQQGLLDSEFYDLRTAIEKITDHKNVKIHFFQDDETIITDLDNYKDYSHFKPEINSYMSKEMMSGSQLLSKENYKERIDSFYKFLTEFDYEGFINENIEKAKNK